MIHFEWTEAVMDQLVALVLEGKKSFSQIGAELGCGKNAAIGKWHRIRDRRGIVRLVPVKPTGTRKTARARPETAKTVIGGAMLRPVKQPAPAPVYGNVCGILEVTGCRWPVGHNRDVPGGHMFCNHSTESGESYCAPHASESAAPYSNDLIRRTVKSTLAILRTRRAA